MALSRSKSGGNAWLRALPVRTLPLLLPTRNAHLLLAEASTANDPSRYLITLEQMIENDYPVPSYMADTFQKPDDAWVEIPKEESSILDDFQARRQPKQRSVYALDCEMVCDLSISHSIELKDCSVSLKMDKNLRESA